MIDPAVIREIHRLCQEWNRRAEPQSPFPRWMQRLPWWVSIVATLSGLLLLDHAIRMAIPIFWKQFMAGFGLATLLAVAVFLMAYGVYGARSLWRDVRDSLNPFPPTEDKELEENLEFLRRLASFTDAQLLFVARSLETKSKSYEDYRAAIVGIGSLLAASLAFAATYQLKLPVNLSVLGWPKDASIWVVGIVQLFTLATVVGGGIGIISVWLESISSARRALHLRRVVEDREMLTSSDSIPARAEVEGEARGNGGTMGSQEA